MFAGFYEPKRETFATREGFSSSNKNVGRANARELPASEVRKSPECDSASAEVTLALTKDIAGSGDFLNLGLAAQVRKPPKRKR